MTNAGQRNQVVELQRAIRSVAASGERSVSWYTYTTAWAKIDARAGRESEAARTVAETGSVVITMPYYPGVLATDRIKYVDRIFQIQGVDNVGELNEELEIMASEVVRGAEA